VGAAAYLAGLAPNIDFEDCGVAFKTGQHTCVKAGCFNNVLINDEWSPHDPNGGHQRKSYSKGVGLIQVEPVGGTDPEILVLDSFTHLNATGLGQVRDKALQMDARGNSVSRAVYGTTPHAQ
jgi:hypothetical protein